MSMNELTKKVHELKELNAQMEQNELGRFHEFSVGVRVGAQLMIEMLKEL